MLIRFIHQIAVWLLVFLIALLIVGGGLAKPTWPFLGVILVGYMGMLTVLGSIVASTHPFSVKRPLRSLFFGLSVLSVGGWFTFRVYQRMGDVDIAGYIGGLWSHIIAFSVLVVALTLACHSLDVRLIVSGLLAAYVTSVVSIGLEFMQGYVSWRTSSVEDAVIGVGVALVWLLFCCVLEVIVLLRSSPS